MRTTAGEERVLREARSGDLVDLEDLEEEERVVSADAIRRLCVGPEAEGVDPRAIRVAGAHVAGVLELAFATVAHPLSFDDTTPGALRPRRG